MALGPLLRPVWDGLRLRCPRCRRGKMFRGLFAMHPRCGACGLVFEDEAPGEYTGAMMLSQFGFGALGLFSWFALFGLRFDLPAWLLVAWVLAFGVVGPLLGYRHVKGLWAGILHAGRTVFGRDVDA